MELGNGFPNEPLEWILAILLTGLAFAVYRRLFNMLLCGFGITHSSRIRKAESFVERYSEALAAATESPAFSSLSAEDQQLYLEMLEENLSWSVDRVVAEQSRHIQDNLESWIPPRPTAAEIMRSRSGGIVFRLNRHPLSEDWQSVINKLWDATQN
jgi:hypothetical protein